MMAPHTMITGTTRHPEEHVTSRTHDIVAGGFAGRVALVTGAASGIGRESALAFARAGARVVVSDVDEAGGHESVELIKAAGGDAIFVRCDVSRSNEVATLVDATIEAFGQLDYAHNNAGILGASSRTGDCDEDEWDRIIAINLAGVWYCLKHELRVMRANGGAIVNTASAAGLNGAREPGPAYVASKHGVVGLTRKAAREYAQDGIRVNAICPGWVRTPLVSEYLVDPETEAMVSAMSPLGRMGTPQEMAAAVVWLCSDAAAYINGVSLVIDGGMLA
jgi:NAD(P)-dependent dehydrogenase (short-subunit alcohol dehydrogenase family)